MKRYFIKKNVAASKKVTASYNPRRQMQKGYQTKSNTQQQQERYKRYQELESRLERQGASITCSTQVTTGFSFDFTWKDDYDAQEIESVIYRVFQDDFNLEVLAIDFYSVDYDDIKEYAGKNISQCGVDFAWKDNYPDEDIAEAIAEALQPLGYTLIGYDFYTI